MRGPGRERRRRARTPDRGTRDLRHDAPPFGGARLSGTKSRLSGTPSRLGSSQAKELTATTTSGRKDPGPTTPGPLLETGQPVFEETFRHFDTITRLVSSRAAISSLSRPDAAMSTILARVTSRYDYVYRRARASSSRSCAVVRSSTYGLFLVTSSPFGGAQRASA